MKKILISIMALIVVDAVIAMAQKPMSFSEAKVISARLGKPILMEFIHED